jgi:deoxyribonuclease-1
MMKLRQAGVYMIFVFTIFLTKEVYSQTLTVSSQQLDFGNAFENAPDSLPLSVFNNLGHNVSVTGIKFYNTYGSPAFSASMDNFLIADGSSQLIWIKFSPRHNIFHNSEMVIENTSLRGYVRVDLIGQGKYSNSYYNATENLSEENLKSSLHVITGAGYDTLGYNFARDSMFMWLDNKRVNGQGASLNTLESIYTGALATAYISRSDCQTTFSFNTEHTFPQSFFSQAEPMRSDLHHLFPTDDASNNFRADNPFGVVINPTWSAGGSRGTNTLFEPRDQQKGATARAMFYFVLRYQNYNNFLTSQEAVLRTWHQNFLPDQIERKRNDDINLIQHNRNPFVDYPQFIERIHSISGFSTEPVSASVDFTQDTIVYGFVQQSTAAVFNYVIVNKGNTVIQFSNFNLSNPAILSFQSGGNNVTLAPGEAHVIEINLTTLNASVVHEFLTFNTNVSGSTNVSVPIYANDSIVSGILANENTSSGIEIFPNPAHEQLLLTANQHKLKSVRIIDAFGREVKNETDLQSVQALVLDVKSLHPGIYFLFVITESGMLNSRFIKE